VVKRLVFAACGSVSVFCLLAFLPQWPGDMFAPFRLQFLCLGFLFLGFGFVSGSRWLLASSLLVVFLSATPVVMALSERQRLPAEAGQGQAVSVIAMNVLHFNSDYERATALAIAQNSDVLAAFETTPEWLTELSVLDRTYPYSYRPERLKTAGISIHSKAPFKAELYRIGSRNAPLVKAEFKDYIVLAAHPYPPATPQLTADLRLYIETLKRLASRQSKPVIIAGDLNATLWSPSLTPLLNDDWQWPANSGLNYTWPTFAPPFAIQIDHVLTKGVKAGRYRVLTPIGSDHLPIRADLVL
jgi:vancomycin resistance protein VanJ